MAAKCWSIMVTHGSINRIFTCIIQDGNSDHFEDFSWFIRTNGPIVVQCPQSDIVQMSLQQPNSQEYRTALECAKMDKFDFHVKWWQVSMWSLITSTQLAESFEQQSTREQGTWFEEHCPKLRPCNGHLFHRQRDTGRGIHPNHLSAAVPSRRAIQPSTSALTP